MADSRRTNNRVSVPNARDARAAKKAAQNPVREPASRTSGRSTSGASSSRTGASGRGAASTSSRSSSGKSTSRSTNTGRSTASTGKSASSRQTRPVEVEQDNSLRDEIIIIITLLVSVLLILSYIGLCGSFGKVINTVVFGLIGILGYVFPAVLLFIVIFCVANKNNSSITSKALFCVLFFIFLASFIQIVGGGFNEKLSFADYFTHSVKGYSGTDKTLGGFLGGMICKLLCPFLGNIGAACVDAALMIVFFLLIAGKALFTEFTRDRLDERREKRERLRAEREEEEYERSRRPVRPQSETRVPKSKSYEDEFEDGIDLSEFDDLDGDATKSHKKDSIIDNFMRRGMGLEINRIGETEEYQDLRSSFEQTKFDVSEVGRDGSDPDAYLQTTDIAEAELRRKFGARKDTETVDPHEYPTATRQPMVTTYLIDEEEEPDDPSDASTTDESVNADRPISFEARSKARQELKSVASAMSSKTESNKKVDPVEPAEPVKAEDATADDPEDETFSEEALSPEATVQEIPEYVFPPVSLLKKCDMGSVGKADHRELQSTVDKLQSTFASFGVNVTVTDATVGPTVTRYEILPDQGVKVKTITSLADDIKLALAAAEIRIEAPIPGKAAVGIEVPNSKTSPVLFGDLIDTKEFSDAASKLTFAVGKDIGGKTICFDIAGMPHMLIAGATGSGKSVCINALIMSILYKAKPSEVKMIMIDPKRVELVGYNGIPHLLVPVVTDVKKATGALNWAIAEMDDRYERFANTGVNNLASYNRVMEERFCAEGKTGECPDKLPQILIIVDELNDLMMTANSKEVEASICRLTQLARASGIHVVLATQRPSVNVITGTIKANIPSRIAFSVSSIVDSRTIIDQAGAEKLLGKGDMLFFPQGYPKPVRLQGAFVSDHEVADVVAFIKQKSREVKYSEKVSRHIDDNSAPDSKDLVKGVPGAGSQGDERDEFYEEAGRFIIEKQKASIGMLQRMYKIGFNRAARIMDALAEDGVVGPEEGTKPRKILMNMQQFDEFINGDSSEEGDPDGELSDSSN